MNKIKALVIDDEFFNRGLITMLVTKLNDNFVICGEGESVAEGVKKINELTPDVVFLDIKMPDGSGFDLLSKFETINFEIVFITGFDTYALKAFEFNALDYILKPVDLDKFKKTLERVQRRIVKKSQEVNALKQIIRSFHSSGSITTKIPVYSGQKVILLDIDEILYINAQENETVLYLNTGERLISDKSLKDFEFVLFDFMHFAMISDLTCINLNHVKNYQRNNKCLVTMSDNTHFEISREKQHEVISLLDERNTTNYL